MTGDLISGRYRVEGELGRGGMGVVLRARDMRLDRAVALKMLRSDITSDPQLRRNLATEARIASSLRHPGIAAVYDLVEQDGDTFIVYEFVSGRTLRQELASGSFSTRDVIDAGIQLADALATAHEHGVIHRDLKPENIMITPAAEGRGRLTILDFGLAKHISEPLLADKLANAETISNPTSPGVLLGTIPYMAPEQLEGDPADTRSDIYAVGVILFEIATGTHPFRGRTPSSTIANVLKQETPSLLERNPAMPAEFGRVVTRCLQKRSGERYQRARELFTDLTSLRLNSGADPHPLPHHKIPQSLFRRWLPFLGDNPFRRWEILHIRILLKCVVLWYLTYKFWTYAPGTWGLILTLSEVLAIMVVYGLIAILLYTGAVDRSNLGREMQRLNRWIRTGAWTAGALAWAMTGTIVASHPILAVFLLVMGTSLIAAVLVLKPALDRAALSPPL